MNRKNQGPNKFTADRRTFLNVASKATVASAPLLLAPRMVHGAPSVSKGATTAVTEFYESLSDQQLLTLCYPFDHPLRQRVNANWNITRPLIGDDFYSDKQRRIINEILRNITSEEGYEKLVHQMDDDNGGVESYSVALFGDPARGEFEWEMTGRHLTLRADGDSVDKTAFGGPLIYGHGDENPKYNMYHFQTKKANEVFQALDGSQRDKALLPRAPRESDIAIQGTEGTFPGIAVGDLKNDQKELVQDTLKVLLAPFREEDVNEVMDILKETGGVDALHMAFYQQGDLDGDQVWDMWRVEGPSFVWNFRGSPHVHAFINISAKPQTSSQSRSNRPTFQRGNPQQGGRRGRGR